MAEFQHFLHFFVIFVFYLISSLLLVSGNCELIKDGDWEQLSIFGGGLGLILSLKMAESLIVDERIVLLRFS